MKVLWFSNSPAAGSASEIRGTGGWLASLDRCIQNSIDLHVVYTYPYRREPYRAGNTHYYPMYSGNILFEGIKRRFLPSYHHFLTEQYLGIIRVIKPDLIHIHGTENDFCTILDKTAVPVIVSIQGDPTVYAHKYNSGFHGKFLRLKTSPLSLAAVILGRDSFRKGYQRLKNYSAVEIKYLPYARYVIGRTDWDYRITRVLAPRSSYFVVNEILRDSFYGKSWNMSPPIGKVIIHTTNSNNYYKGFETLCFSLSLLIKMGLDVEWRVAGISESSRIVDITRRYLGNNYPKRGLSLLGSLNEEELVRSMLSSHIYVMPSHIENSPNSLCEAMLLGMPCIATHAGGSASLLRDHIEGIVVQDGDPWAMAGAVIEYIHNWDKTLEFGKRARMSAQDRHDRKHIVEGLIETYNSVLVGETGL